MLLKLLFVLLLLLIFPSITLARTTPFGEKYKIQREAYQTKVQNYSPENKQKLTALEQRIAALNKERTEQLSLVMQFQGQILEEYIRRNDLAEKINTNGINRNLSDPIEKARYWITYAHEAVAYQTSKEYIFTLTSEKNIKQDANNLISIFQSDLESTRKKVINSQQMLEEIVK